MHGYTHLPFINGGLNSIHGRPVDIIQPVSFQIHYDNRLKNHSSKN